MRAKSLIAGLYAAVLATATVGLPERGGAAEPAGDFYHGKTIEIDVGASVGGGYDANARLIARHLGRFIPGSPTIIVNNMPGSGGIRVANYLYNVAPRDGTVLGAFSNAMITEPLLGGKQSKFAPDKFTWIGSPSREDGICLATKASGVDSWNDVLHKEVIIGTSAAGTTTYMYPVMLKNMFGAKFKLVSGYPDGAQIEFALERNEVQAICQTYSSVKVKHPTWLRDRLVTPLLAIGLARLTDFPDLPSVMDIAKTTQQKQILQVILAPTLAGRPIFAPPGIPADRAAALVHAFVEMTNNKDFLADADKMHVDVEPASAADLDTLVKQIYALSANVIAETKRVVTAEAAN